ncbi:glycosyltransferase [Bifidobacterium sp. 82T10]|uniref:Glycosyltransferase n=1 Tax=Bifidobacterium miconis TaxID=2834435 RepID=A0ABS6WHA7_9BIFI|nr:glycosyltransferase [Bifidobacterium miconis]MBW3093429.1 glycosyltransferase [Bifidobacterium miconis]
MYKIAAGIVTFNPDISRLKENLDSISQQVDHVYVVDNGSLNFDDILHFANDHISINRNLKNFGIARALNQIIEMSGNNNYTHILFLDQDSVASSNMCKGLAEHIQNNIGIIAPHIIDRNRDEQYYPKGTYEIKNGARNSVITSGSLVDIKIAKEIGAFDSDLFIDYVDFDFNERILEHGYKIIVCSDVFLLHEKGKSEPTWLKVPCRSNDGKLFLKRIYRLGYNSFRNYYQARNRVIYTRKYFHSVWWKFEGINEIPFLIGLTLLFDSQKFLKIKAFLRGMFDGIKFKLK